MAHPSLFGALPGGNGLQRLSLSSSLSLYLLENEAILYSAGSRCLFGLDCSATSLLLRLADGETLASLTTDFDTAATAAIAKLADLLAGREPCKEEYRGETFCSAAVPSNGCISPCYQLLTTCFTLDCSDEALRKIMVSSIRHLLIPDQAKIDLSVTVLPVETLWSLRFNGTDQGDAVPVDMLLPKLYDRLRKFAYQRLPYLLAVHAAVVTDGYRTIIFPGKSGSGKSTLAASLLAQGYRLFSDEVAVVTANGELVPIPLGLGLKSGSWDLLARDYPALADTEEHIRWDGSMVRYLEAENLRFTQRTDCRRATHLCFPSFLGNGPACQKTLTPVTALRYLTEAGYQVRNLDEGSLERIVSWLLDLSCSTITYSSSKEALQLFEIALNSPVARYSQVALHD